MGSVRDVVPFDRPHLEALIPGVATGPELVTAANRSVSVYGRANVPLAALLHPRAPRPAVAAARRAGRVHPSGDGASVAVTNHEIGPARSYLAPA